jgi:hypothetical protein
MADNKALEALELIAKAKLLVEEYVLETKDDQLDEDRDELMSRIEEVFTTLETEELHFIFMSCGGY